MSAVARGITASRGTWWAAWEEGNAASGLAAVYHEFQTREALDVVVKVSRAVALHAMGQLSQGGWRIAYQPPFTFAKIPV